LEANFIGDIGCDQLNWLFVDESQSLDVGDQLTRADIQKTGNLFGGWYYILMQHPRPRFKAALNHILVETSQFLHESFADLGRGDESAFPFLTMNHTLKLKLAQRLADDCPADLVVFTQVLFPGFDLPEPILC
jgi:hypothetical protein